MSTEFKSPYGPFFALEFPDEGKLFDYRATAREPSLRKQGRKLSRTRHSLKKRSLSLGGVIRSARCSYSSREHELDIVPPLQGKGPNGVTLRRGEVRFTLEGEKIRVVTIKKVEKPPIARELTGETVASLKRELIERFEGLLSKFSRSDFELATVDPRELNSLVEQVVKNVISDKVVEEEQGVKVKVMRNKEGAAVAPVKERNEAMQDPNYQAYLREAPKLRKERGECVVAYSEGKRIAVGQNRREVMSKIPAEYKNSQILIQDVPDRVMKSHKPFRVRR